jgi:hypothetical protein
MTAIKKVTNKKTNDIISKSKQICASCNKSKKNKKVTKSELLKSLPVSQLGKITTKLNIGVDTYFKEKDSYIEALMGSQKVTVAKIKEVLNM